MATKKYAAEGIGTFILVFIGGLSVISANVVGISPLVIAPWGFGLGLLIAIYAVGHISGGHYNPAVTVAMLLDKRLSSKDAVGYIIAQFLGGTVAAVAMLPVNGVSMVATTQNAFSGSSSSALFLEIILTALFVLVIMVVSKGNPSQAPIVISLSLVAMHFAGIPLSGASLNPARTFGPAVIGSPTGHLWVYFVGPILGALVAYAFNAYFRPDAE